MTVDLAKRRVTVRKFLSKEIPLEKIIKIIEAGRQAPSGANKQPWRFVVVGDADLKRRIREECEKSETSFHSKAPEWMKKWLSEKKITPVKEFLTEAPYLIVVCSEKAAVYHVQSVWLCIGYMLLVIEEEGLATVTYTPSKITEIRKTLKIPDEYMVEAILPVGYAAEKPEKSRRALIELICNNTWTTSFKESEL
jgi:nitroreductase